MKDGIYFNMPESEYHSLKRLSSSGLREILESPTAYWFNNLNPVNDLKDDTQALFEGRLMHTMILEPENFNKKYKVIPAEIEDLNKNSSAFKVWKLSQTGELVGSKKYNELNNIIKYLSSKGQVLYNDIFKGGYAEVSILWTQNGIERKARIDYLTPSRLIDLKTFIKTTRGSLDQYVAQYFFKFKVYLQLIYYMQAIEEAKAQNLPVIGTDKQREFWYNLSDQLMTMVVFVSRQLPLARVKVFRSDECPELHRLGKKQIEQAENIYNDFLINNGLKKAWLEEVRTDQLLFNDSDFPQSFYEILEGV